MARTLLIVDDIRSNREILKNMLGGEYEIIEAANGEEALRLLLKNCDRISAVLLDVSMLGLSGYEVLEKMRSNALLATMPVIMITGNETEEARVKALNYGANDFVIKPYNADVIRHCLNNNIALREAKNTVDLLRRDSVAGTFIYDPAITQHIAWQYDNHGFWNTLLSDFVAETATVQKMHELVRGVATGRDQETAQIVVRLKAPQKQLRR